MNVVKYSVKNGQHKLLCVLREDLDRCRKKEVEVLSGFPMRVVATSKLRSLEDERVRHLPIVHLDQLSKIDVKFEDVMDAVVVVLNVDLFLREKVVFFDGMEDVFFITKKRVAAQRWDSIDEDSFGFYWPGTNNVRDEVLLYFTRTSVTSTIHRTMQLNRHVSVGISMTMHHFQTIVHDWLRATTVEKESNNYEYNVLSDRRGRKVKIVKTLLKADVLDVDAFERCFGFVSTIKHNCSMRNLNNLVSFATTNGIFICKNVEDSSKFETMEWSYDIVGQQCFLHFKYRNGVANELNTFIFDKQEAWNKSFEERWAPPSIQNAAVPVDPLYPFGGRVENRKRAADAMMVSIDFARIEAVFTHSLGIDYQENAILRYVVLNMCKQGGETVANAVVRLLKDYKDSSSVDQVIRELYFNIDFSLDKNTKIKRVADEFQRLYDNVSFTN